MTDITTQGAAIYLLVFLVCLGLSAFFASAEIAFVNLQRIRLKHLQDTGHQGADRVAKIMEHPEKFLSVVLTSVSFTETIAIALGSFLCVYLWGETIGTFVGIVLIATILLVFVKVVPKTIAAQHPEWLALHYAPVIEATSTVVSPVVFVLSRIIDIIARPTGARTIRGALMSKQELQTCISMIEEGGVVDGTSAQMLKRAIKFSDRSVREVMTPRTEVVWIKEGATLADFHQVYATSSHMRYPIYEGNFDNVKGVLPSRAVHVALSRGELGPDSVVTKFARPVYYVPGTKLVGELFNEMRDRGSLLAVVVSEHGGTSGVVTIHQLAEEIVGEVREELVVSAREYEHIDSRICHVNGTMKIDRANEQLGLCIPEGKYDTIAGFVLYLLGHLPAQGEQVSHANLELVVSEIDGNRIAKVIVTKTLIQSEDSQETSPKKESVPESRSERIGRGKAKDKNDD